LKTLSLEIRFDKNLHDYAVNPGDFRQALSNLENQLQKENDVTAQIKLLGQVGTHQRILILLKEAEITFKKAISLASSNGHVMLKLVNLVRLGNTKHWQGDFTEAHQLFEECFEVIAKDKTIDGYRDFIFQHRGKCYFDQGQYDLALKNFYEAILIRNNKSETDFADNSLLAIEETKRRWLPQVPMSTVSGLLNDKLMPDHVKYIIGKKHGRELVFARLNCINAALNFHAIEIDRLKPFKPMDMLEFLREKTDQKHGLEDYQFGDLIIWWNRNEGSWANRKIILKEMNYDDPDFPYGLIFDHVAVRVATEIVYNKPNPSPDSEYRFDYVDTASYPSKFGMGHEFTLHRVR